MATGSPNVVDATAGVGRKDPAAMQRGLGTLGGITKRLRVGDEEFRRLEEEGQKAIRLADKPQVPEEFRSYRNKVLLQPGALEARDVRKLIDILLEWVNEVLAERRILLRDFTEDFCDGQILTELLEELTGETLMNEGTVALSESQQRVKLQRVLDYINDQLGIFPEDAKWSVDAIYYKDAVATLHLLVALARVFHCPLQLPKNVRIRTLRVIRQADDRLVHEEVVDEITGNELNPTGTGPGLPDKDVFDRLFEQAPEKLRAVQSSLVNFANKHLAKMKLEIDDVSSQLHDGVYLIFLMCLLEGYCLPLCDYHLKPKTLDQKLRNAGVAFRLMDDAGLFIQRVKPDEIVHKNLKGTLRVLYAIYSKFKYCD